MFRIYAAIFALSGAAGLIYESVWSHYLKLILGHAAYAQTLVLAIFMGGMAIGAWYASRITARIANLLFAYAVVECVIGFVALGFHGVFQFSSALLLDRVLPALEPGLPSTLAKLVFAGLLILPQSLLLGSTFPLLTGGVIRRDPQSAGAMIALLYFSNSIGAVAGVLGAGFWLIPKVGLPGALLTAGIINVLLAILVYGLAKQDVTTEAPPDTPEDARTPALSWVLWAAGITGAASFFYEIAWIRMLSMVLGSSTHSFELMLAAFILGLALGGLWIKKRIDRIADPKRFLGLVQLAMGALAVLTLPLYDTTFTLMSEIISALAKTESGYAYFSVLSHGIALLVMLPATFCAGMTLPIMTLILMRSNRGERAIGQVYAANTLGSILGVVAAVHLVLPGVGLKGLLLLGALLDGALGTYLVGMAAGWAGALRSFGWTAAFGVVWMSCALLADLDARRMASGVYRYGRALIDAEAQLVKWADGKTASVGLVLFKDGILSILTNGKPDASINAFPEPNPTPDEYTMAFAAIVPLMHRPQIRNAANIGFGSGMTTHTLLASPHLAKIDTIEIEPRMLELARLAYEKLVPRAFHDPRSVVHIDDARAYFSRQNAQYDLIVSEPSNPWVSGVASLFSAEFYAHVKRYLAPEGIFVQWLQLYESAPQIVSSVAQALDQHFEDYAIYAPDGADLLIVASPKTKLGPIDPSVLDLPEVRKTLQRLDLAGLADVETRYLGSKETWSPVFRMIGAPVNSDFFPFVDQQAPRFRFLGQQASQLVAASMSTVPILEAVRDKGAPLSDLPIGTGKFYEPSELAGYARQIRDHVVSGADHPLLIDIRQELATLRTSKNCKGDDDTIVYSLHNLASRLIPFLNPEDLEAVWRALAADAKCLQASARGTQWWQFLRLLGARDFDKAGAMADRILAAEGENLAGTGLQTLITASLCGHLLGNNAAAFAQTREKYYLPALKAQKVKPTVSIDILYAQAHARGWKFAVPSN